MPKPYLYRDAANSLEDSMATVMEVTSKRQIKAHLNKFYKEFGKEVDAVKIGSLGIFDKRTGWYTFNVSFRLKGEVEWKVAGQTNGKVR